MKLAHECRYKPVSLTYILLHFWAKTATQRTGRPIFIDLSLL